MTPSVNVGLNAPVKVAPPSKIPAAVGSIVIVTFKSASAHSSNAEFSLKPKAELTELTPAGLNVTSDKSSSNVDIML